MKSINLNPFLSGLSIILAIFISYNFLDPMGDGYNPLDDISYRLITHKVNTDNKWSSFRDEKNGSFFVHPGSTSPSIGAFTFKEPGKLVLDFSIRDGSKSGNIEFTIKQNSSLIDNFVITTKNPKQLLLDVEKWDKVIITASKNGDTNGDWGDIQISLKKASFENKTLAIPVLWSILYILLLFANRSHVVINTYILFTLILFAEKLNFGALNFEAVITYTFLLFSLSFLLLLISQIDSNKKDIKPSTLVSFIVSTLIYIIPLFCIIYALNFDDKITKETLYATFQSNKNESYEYVSEFIDFEYILLSILTIAVISLLSFKQNSDKKMTLAIPTLIFSFLSFAIISTILFSHLRLPNLVINSYGEYSIELEKFKKIQSQRNTEDINYTASKETSGETYIVVIGESLNKKHMGIYGYMKNTTPSLSKIHNDGKLIIFNNAYSNHVHTVPALKLSLTEANQYNKFSYYDSASIIEILNKADIETHWVTNQSIYSTLGNMISVIASTADNLVSINKNIGDQSESLKYDSALIGEVKQILAKKHKRNRVIFVHLMGNHTRYDLRYPNEQYSIFNTNLKLGEFGTIAGNKKSISYYDNSVIYNDFVVSSILKQLQNHKGVRGLIYLSDHAEDVISGLGHNSNKFTFEMAQIPMLAWFSKAYKKQYESKYNTLLNNTNRLYSNDLLYDTLIGIFDITTNRYNSIYDLTSKKYQLNRQDALILNGKKHYTDDSNYIFWQKNNSKLLVESNQSSRIFPHRVNSIGKLKEIWNEGFRSFEVDVKFSADGTGKFHAGHNQGGMGLTFEEFLSKIDTHKLERVWVDFKNLNTNNHRNALSKLQYLDRKFNIKNKFIIESETKKPFFSKFQKDGWHTSYYLPISTIISLLEKDDKHGMTALSQRISQQVKEQNISAISFDHRTYQFVKNYLEPKIPLNIVYHTWHTTPLRNAKFKEELENDKLYMDKRVKSLLSIYQSQFDL